jgi:hypothetical protein
MEGVIQGRERLASRSKTPTRPGSFEKGSGSNLTAIVRGLCPSRETTPDATDINLYRDLNGARRVPGARHRRHSMRAIAPL